MSGDPSRRDVLAAPLALAALAACDGPDEFGHPLHAPGSGGAGMATLATVLDLDGLGRGVLVRTRAGHAIKVEGNPDHPGSLGASDVFLESAPLSLHDPARSRRALHRNRATATDAPAWEGLRGEGLWIVTGPLSSPTARRLLEEALRRFPGARWHAHDPLADAAAEDAARRVWGQDAVPLPDLRAAPAVLCLGADPLGHGPAQLALARAWREGRPRLLVAEPSPTLTGARADTRLSLHPHEAPALARAVAAALGVPGLAAGASHAEAARLAAALPRGSLVLAGRGMPAEVHALAAATTAHLGGALRWIEPPAPRGEPAAAFRAALEAGEVRRLLLLDADPAFDIPALAPLLARVPHAVHAGPRANETAALCTWHVPLAHPLESWGDSLAFDGTPALRQPAARPQGPALRDAAGVLLALLGRAPDSRGAVQDSWRAAWGEAGFDERWDAALERGVAGDAAPALTLGLRPGWDQPAPPPPAGPVALLAPDPHLRAGAFAHEAWLQELPRPLTRLSWGNALLVAPEDAAAQGWREGDEIRVTAPGGAVSAPVLPLPGQARGVVVLPLGFGTRAGGPVGEGRGTNAAALRPADGGFLAGPVRLAATGRRLALARTANEDALDAAEAVKVLPPGGALPRPAPLPSFHDAWPGAGARWGMAIDLDACIGCNACAAACQAENNVPAVGPDAMGRGRDLLWLRVDTHARPHGTAAFQPVPCQHCEQAPCEPVCPVNATVHDSEGLNAMVYPRCIGTRTCSNACPYKVRRFNWADHRPALDTPARNPDVALRQRGVMEKCSFCVHRIQAARRDGGLESLETACQRACPTRAITFGDLAQPGPVAEAHADGRAYHLLGALGTRPRVAYLARVERGEG